VQLTKNKQEGTELINGRMIRRQGKREREREKERKKEREREAAMPVMLRSISQHVHGMYFTRYLEARNMAASKLAPKSADKHPDRGMRRESARLGFYRGANAYLSIDNID
jgi:hypothetical protein